MGYRILIKKSFKILYLLPLLLMPFNIMADEKVISLSEVTLQNLLDNRNRAGFSGWQDWAWDHHLGDINRWSLEAFQDGALTNRIPWIERPQNISRLLMTGMPNTHISLIGNYQPQDHIFLAYKKQWQITKYQHYNKIKIPFVQTMSNIGELNKLIQSIEKDQKTNPSKEIWFPAFMEELKNVLILNVNTFEYIRKQMIKTISDYPLN